jgi:hypothetical protein
MGFGGQQQSGGGDGGKTITFEKRVLTFVDEQTKTTSGGKTYWRVQDNIGPGHWYSVWEQSLIDTLHEIQDADGAVPCCVKVEKTGAKTFYGITAAGANVDAIIASSTSQQATSEAPGGRNSQYGKKMDPATEVRVTKLAAIKEGVPLAVACLPDKPADTSAETFLLAKSFQFAEMIARWAQQPLTELPTNSTDQQQKKEEQPPDDDIPF